VDSGPDENCRIGGVGANAFSETAQPTAGAGFWYLVRGRNACGAGSYGADSEGNARIPVTCP
jgi:hypothetical protein